MPDSKSSFLTFWTTLPGILTGVGSVLAAGVAAAALILPGGDGGTSDNNGGDGPVPLPPVTTTEQVTLADWAEQANNICAEAYEDIRALNIPPDAESQFMAIPQLTRISTRADQKLQALDRPPEAESEIGETLALSSRAGVTVRNAYNYWSAGDLETAQAFLEEYNTLVLDLQRRDGELGANVCAQGP